MKIWVNRRAESPVGGGVAGQPACLWQQLPNKINAAELLILPFFGIAFAGGITYN